MPIKTEGLLFAANTSKAVPQVSDRCPFGSSEGCFGDADCNGCCGPGCGGCSGYYTNACLAHDNCVGNYGQTSCFNLLPAAIASLAEAVNNGYGDWPPRGDEDEFYLEENAY